MDTAEKPCYCKRCRGERVRNLRYIERETIVSRTDDFRQGGASDRTGSGGGGGAPFIKWPKGADYAWVEGEVLNIWEGKFGDSVTLKITAHSKALVAKGRGEDGEEVMSRPTVGDEVNVGLNSSALQDTLSRDDKGKVAHIAFEGWEESKGGNQYRLFTVLLMEDRAPSSDNGATESEPPKAEWGGVDEQAEGFEESDPASLPF